MSCIVLPCHAIWYLSQDTLHHGQVLAIVVRLEERDPQIEFEQDATDEEIKINTRAHTTKFHHLLYVCVYIPNGPNVTGL